MTWGVRQVKNNPGTAKNTKTSNSGLNESFHSTQSNKSPICAIKEALCEEKFNAKNVMLLVVELLEDHEKALQKIECLEAQVDALFEEKRVDEERKKKEECLAKRNHLLIRGIELHSDAKDGVET